MKLAIERAKPFTGVADFVAQSGAAHWVLPLPASEPVFGGHYPGNPILPGIYTLESITQGVEMYYAQQNQRVRLERVKNMRFMAPLVPGDRVRITVETGPGTDINRIQVKALVWRDEVKAASAKLQFLILEA